MLHLIFQAQLDHATLERTEPGDSIIFLENAFLRLLKNNPQAGEITKLLSGRNCYVLAAEIEIRGIQTTELISTVSVIDYTDWVNLTVEHHLIQSWT